MTWFICLCKWCPLVFTRTDGRYFGWRFTVLEHLTQWKWVHLWFISKFWVFAQFGSFLVQCAAFFLAVASFFLTHLAFSPLQDINVCIMENYPECSNPRLFYIVPYFCGQHPQCRLLWPITLGVLMLTHGIHWTCANHILVCIS